MAAVALPCGGYAQRKFNVIRGEFRGSLLAKRLKKAPAEFNPQGNICMDQFVGMAIMDLSSCPGRKTALAHVEALKLALSGDPSAHLLMKVRYSKHTQFV